MRSRRTGEKMSAEKGLKVDIGERTMFELFTDFNAAHSPRYFYGRGIILGFVLATYVWLWIVPWIRKRCKKHEEGKK